jgi:hypothetical protein
MIASFSPLTRRVLALGILVLGLLGLLNLIVLPLHGLTADSLSSLEDARFERARLEAIAARPPLPRSSPVPDSLYLAAPDRQRASDALIAGIGQSAARYEVQLDAVVPMPPEPGREKTIAVSVGGRGEHDKLLAWINELERGNPAIHFAEWLLAPEGETAPVAPAPAVAAGSGTVRLAFNGTAVVVWEPGR